MPNQHARQLRNNPTQAEHYLWYFLQRRNLLGFKFRRQQPLGQYIVDFVNFETRLIIELDGGHHSETVEYDTTRTEWLAKQGFKVLRFWNNDVLGNVEGVLERIIEKLQ